jgi:hypothetical protein
VMWGENYVMLWPWEKMDIRVEDERKGRKGVRLEVRGRNVAKQIVQIGG